MSASNPCTSCGACCSHFRVSFFWGETASAGGTVPDELVTSISPHRVAMAGTDQKPARCVALKGEVGSCVACTIYEQRSAPCREFDASWEHGEHNARCDAARAAHGLAPIPAPAGLKPHSGACGEDSIIIRVASSGDSSGVHA
ncbi:YkgJ family cysteine cluster protein [Pseudomonas nitroreducens]|uniref:YkgJ family cysteine cluster protein n=1 Tax=Pseudomonas nitroreducens TaxID=46680 RepID=UPI0016192FDB|nr:YkgJ family cysteine cluster protein [Pseudomonas nitritireducens]